MFIGREPMEPSRSLVRALALEAFLSGWREGTARQAISPVAEDVLDEIALMLEATGQSAVLTRLE